MTRNEAIDVLKANYPDAHYSELREAVDLAIKVLEEPERKKGKWIRSGEGSYQLYECSLCGKPWLHWWADAMDSDRMSKEVKCCPNCGADMRTEE